MIEGRDLSVRLGSRDILTRASFRVEGGERVALLGLNGAGKTTLFRCLLGMAGYRGHLTVDGQEIRTAGPTPRKLIGYVPQRPPRYDGTLAEMLALFTALRGIPMETVTAQLATMGLAIADHGNKLVGNLSGGMIQKVLLVLAIAADPGILLLDEPTANLDPRARRDLLRILDAVPPSTTVLLSSHRLADVKAVARRVLVLHRGAFVYDGSVQELIDRLGTGVGLRLHVPGADQARALACLVDWGIPRDAINLNGSVEFQLDAPRVAEAIHVVRQHGIPVDDITVIRPQLETELERLLDHDREDR